MQKPIIIHEYNLINLITMKNLRFALLALLSVLIIIPMGCEKDEDEETPTPTVGQTAWSSTGGGSFDYVGMSQAGELVAVQTDMLGSLPKNVFYQTAGGANMMMYLGDNGFPETIYANGAIMVFENATASTLDVGLVSGTGEIEILRGIEFNNSAFFGGGGTISQTFSSVLQYTGYAMQQGLGLSSQIASMYPSAVSQPLTIFSGASLMASQAVAGTAVPVGADVFTSAAQTYGITTVQAPADLLVLGTGVMQISDNTITQLEETINLVESTLQYGYGDVQVTLTWDNTADLDLYVTDPDGETIYYSNPTSASGGQLDVDDTDGYGPENIFWEDGAAPSGQYLVQLHHYSGDSPANYIILVQLGDGTPMQYSGSITDDQMLDIVTFNVSKGEFKVINDKPVVYPGYVAPAKN